MEEFEGKIAVVTGAASGIGRALAERCAKENMKVVLADIEKTSLRQAEDELRASGADVLAVRTDVSRLADVEALAQATMSRFGAVHLLFNNAGVHGGSTVWESTIADWTWVLGVNLWGVIHGLHVFVPLMLEQDTECHIVNTGSTAGLMPTPGWGVYGVSKAGIISLTETMQYELMMRGAKIGVSVLCPGGVRTRLLDAERNRPIELQNAPGTSAPRVEAADEAAAQAIEYGMDPGQLAKHVFAGIREGQLYVLTHPEYTPRIQQRMDGILAGCVSG